jgi:hypothetical protein
MTRWIAAILAAAAILAVAAALTIRAVGVPRATGYFAPVFAPDGHSLFVISRTARAVVTGFGQPGFTPPATVRLYRDRFALLNIRLADGAVTVVEAFPPSPLEGATFDAYHGAIFGVPHAHLRWADGQLEYDIGVTRHDVPRARTFVIRRTWDPKARQFVTTAPWQEGPTSMGGDDAARLHGDKEVLAVPGDELMPCAIALLENGGSAARAVVEADCGGKYPAGLTAATLAQFSRRAEIQRAVTIERTYAALVDRGRAAGLPEGEAMLRAGDEMSRRGLFPKKTTMIAERRECGGPPLFEIADAQFEVGLFPDIERAIASPGVEVDKSMGAYISHRDYKTSAAINEWLDAGHEELPVRARGACWRVRIQRP